MGGAHASSSLQCGGHAQEPELKLEAKAQALEDMGRLDRKYRDLDATVRALVPPLQQFATNQQHMSASLDVLSKTVRTVAESLDELRQGAREAYLSRQSIFRRLEALEVQLQQTVSQTDRPIHPQRPSPADPCSSSGEGAQRFKSAETYTEEHPHRSTEVDLHQLSSTSIGVEGLCAEHPNSRPSDGDGACAGVLEPDFADLVFMSPTRHREARAQTGANDAPEEAITPCTDEHSLEVERHEADACSEDSAGSADIGGELTRGLQSTHEDEVVAGAVRLLEVAPPPVVRMAASAQRFAQAHMHEIGLGDLQVIEYANTVALLILRCTWLQHAEGLGRQIDQATWATLLHRSMRTQLEELADRRSGMNRAQFQHAWQQMLEGLDSMLANVWQRLRGT